jgi:hypothetical protein
LSAGYRLIQGISVLWIEVLTNHFVVVQIEIANLDSFVSACREEKRPLDLAQLVIVAFAIFKVDNFTWKTFFFCKLSFKYINF